MRGWLPGVGHAIRLHRGAVDEVLRASRELGPLVQVSLGFNQWYLFCFGSEAFELLKHKSVAVGGSRASLDYLLGKSLLTVDGAAHKSVRSAMSPSFLPRGLSESLSMGGPEGGPPNPPRAAVATGERRAVSATGRLVSETIARHVEAFVRAGGGEVHEHLQVMALDVIFRIVGVEVASLAAWRAHYKRLFWGLIPLPFEWPGTPRYFALRAAEWLNEELSALLQRARREDGDTLVHTLVRTRDEDGRLLTDGELIDNLRLLFVAGHETTATTMTWAMVHLAERPDWVSRLCDEVEGAALTSPIAFAEMKKLPFCEGVFREASRLYAPAWFIERRLTDDITFRGHHLPSGTILAVCPPEWARDPATYPDPEAFDPDRWVGRKAGPTPIELSAFGGGAHFCMGYHLSWLESVVYLAFLAKALRGGGKGLRPANARRPKVAYFPFPHPSPAAKVDVVERGR